MCWNSADIVEGVRAAGSLCPVLYQLGNPRVIFLASGCCGSHRVVLSLFWNFPSAIGVVFTQLLSVLLKVHLESAVDTMQDICWQAPLAGFE